MNTDKTPEPHTDDELREIIEYGGGLVISEMVEQMAGELLASRARIAALEQAVVDERAGRHVAGESADRFRDVVAEAVGTPDCNPGDDELVRQLRALHGHTGPEPRRWRDFITGAVAHMENNGFRWRSDAALDDGDAND